MKKRLLLHAFFVSLVCAGVFVYANPRNVSKLNKISMMNKANIVYRSNVSSAYLIIRSSFIEDINNKIYPRQWISTKDLYCSKENDLCTFCYNLINQNTGCREESNSIDEEKTYVFDEDIWLMDGTENIKLRFSGRAANFLINKFNNSQNENKLLCFNETEKAVCDTTLSLALNYTK